MPLRSQVCSGPAENNPHRESRSRTNSTLEQSRSGGIMSVIFVPARLITFRHQRQLTLRELAQLSGINFRRIHHFEHGLEPRVDEVMRLARALRCKVSELQEVRSE